MRRFDNPRQLMAYLGLVPGERSSGQTRRVTSITKAGSTDARRLIVEAAWAYRMPAKIGQAMQRRQEALPTSVRDIAWKAQVRLCTRYRRTLARRKKAPVVITAIARELVGFMWAIARAKTNCRLRRLSVPTPEAVARALAPVGESSGKFGSGDADLRGSRDPEVQDLGAAVAAQSL
jgi:hypothetical protein